MHYMASEGGYATDPDGAERTLEFRQMVQARVTPAYGVASHPAGHLS